MRSMRFSVLVLAMISALSCVRSSAALSSPWQNADIGSVGAAGDSSVTNGIFTLSGAGADIWNTADAFQFASQTLSGDGTIIARVASLQNTNEWAKAGVMIRETLDANSRWALVAVTPSNGVTFQWRSETGGNCDYSVTGGIIAPAWVKLVRSGNSFTAYRSADGATWTQIGSPTTLSMVGSVNIGLAVTSHNDPTLCTGTFDNVTVGQASKWPTVSITSPANGSTLTALANVQLTSNASVTDGTLAKVQFFAGSTFLGEATTQPYSISLPPLAVGSYSYTANAITADGFVSASTPVSITVVHPTSDGDGLSGTYFNNVDLTSLTVSRIDPTVNFAWGDGSPSLLIEPDTFSARWLGRVQPYYSELYTFYTNSDDGVRLWVNHQLLIDNWTNHAPTENSATIQLEAGSTYDIKLEFYENYGGATMQLSWSSPSTPKEIVPQSQLFSTGSDMQIGTGDGLHGDYFNVPDLSTQPALTRVDSTVNFNWNGAQPDPLVNATGFSTRWTGQVQAQYSNTYTLSVIADDGVRVWFNGQLKIDEWIDEGATGYSFTADLVAGSKYDIVIEYYQNGGGAVAQLFWASPMTPTCVIPQSQLYSTGNALVAGSGNGLFASYFNTINLSGGLAPGFNTPTLTRTDATVNFDWGTGSPDPAINPDNFSVRWIGQVEPQFTETYTFYVTCDDGARLWINNKLIVDAWTDHAPAEYSGNIDLKAGEKVGIKLEYYEHSGGAMAKLAWSSPSRPKIVVPQSQLSCSTGLAVPIPSFSVTSPAFIEGFAWSPSSNPVAVTANGISGTFYSDNNWFANVPLNGDGTATAVAVTQSGTGSVQSRSIVWWPLDIAGSEASDHNIVIRKGDSLLLTANGQGETLAIDVDGDGVFDVIGLPGQTFPTAYNTAGTYLVVATIEGVQVGTLVVTVMDADIHKPIADELTFTREKNVVVTPAIDASNIVFTSSDSVSLQVALKGPFSNEDGQGTTIYLTTLKRGTPKLLVRLGGDSGPIMSCKEVDEFTLDIPALKTAIINSSTNIGGTTLTIRPYIPDIRFQIDMFAHTSTFAGGAMHLSINTSDLNSVTGEPLFKQTFDPATNEVIGVYFIEIQVPPGETMYCFIPTASQASSEAKIVSYSPYVNGHVCLGTVGKIVICQNEHNWKQLPIGLTGGPDVVSAIIIEQYAQYSDGDNGTNIGFEKVLNCPGSYDPWVIGMSPGVCDVTLNGVIFEKRIYVLDLSVTPNPGIACVGKNMTFVATGEPEGGSYSWSAPGGTPTSGTGPSFTTFYSASGTNTVTCTFSYEGGSCTKSVTAKSVRVSLVTTLTPSVCKGDPITFYAVSDPAGGFPDNAPDWTLIQGKGTLAPATGLTCTVTPDANYVGIIKVLAKCGDKDPGATGTSETVVVVSVTHDKDIICVGDMVTFTAHSSGNGFPNNAPEWDLSGPAELKQNNGDSITVKATGNGYIFAKARCKGDDSFLTDVVPAVIVDKIQYLDDNGNWQDVPDHLSVCIGESVTLKAIASPDVGFPDNELKWSGATGTGDTATVDTTAVGTKTVTATCGSSYKSVTVSVLEVLHIQRNGANVEDTTIYVPVDGGFTLILVAIPNPSEEWPTDKPTWTGAMGVGAIGTVDTTTPGTKTVTATCGYSSKTVTVIVVRLDSKTTVPAADGTTPDTRTTIGVCETVTISTFPPVVVDWSVSGYGAATPISGTSTIFEAADVAHISTVSASINGVSIGSITYTVIVPTGNIFGNPPTPQLYTAGLAGSGFIANVIVQPTSVCFSNIETQEQRATGVATGYYDVTLGWNGMIHNQGVWVSIDLVNNGIMDTVGTVRPGTPEPFSPGVFTWSIPWHYRRTGGGGSYKYTTELHRQQMLGTSGVETTSKGGASNTR